jgi:hypothetical protein
MIFRYPALDDSGAWEAISEDFSSRGLHGVVGAIDGTHFLIKKPPGDISGEYIDRKGNSSIAAQAVVDAHGIFRDVRLLILVNESNF